MENKKTSRLIIKNIPKHYTEERLREKFNENGSVTDAKIIKRQGKTRNFAFVGMKNEEEAEKAKSYFNNTYLDTSKISVTFAYPQKSALIPRPWSKYSKGSLAFSLLHNDEKGEREAEEKEEKKLHEEEKAKREAEIKKKKLKFKDFITAASSKAKSKQTQSWNDVFSSFMADDLSNMKKTLEESEKNKKHLQTKGGRTLSFEGDKNESNIKKKKKKVKQEVKGALLIKENVEKEKLKAGMNKTKTHIKFNADSTTGIDKEIAMHDIDCEEKAKAEKEAEEERQKIEQEKKQNEDNKKASNSIIDETRLFVMNLSYNITEQELNVLFNKFGLIEEVFIPKSKFPLQKSNGYAYVKFKTLLSAVDAYATLDQTLFQGRTLHIKPAEQRKQIPVDSENQDKKLRNFEERSSFKKEQFEKRNINYEDEKSWNFLFINPNTATSRIAAKLQIKKGDLLSRERENVAVLVGESERQTLAETKDWLQQQGWNLDILSKPRISTERSPTSLIVKNLSFQNTQPELHDLFSNYGVCSVKLSPSNTLALVQYQTQRQADVAIKKLHRYKKNHHSLPFYLERAPLQTQTPAFKEKEEICVENADAQDLEGERKEESKSSTVFVKNLNFDTDEDKLRIVFEEINVGIVRSIRIPRKKNQSHDNSMGYGFIQYDSKTAAQNAVKLLQNIIVDDHALKLSLSQTSSSSKAQRKTKKRKEPDSFEDPLNPSFKSNKLMIKNLAFEATKKDLKALFHPHAQIKKIRIPKKFEGNHRGFGFIEFVSPEEAKNAFELLQNTHLYGRKLVIQWAKMEEANIEEIQQKTKQKYSDLKKEKNEGIKTQEKGELKKRKKKKQ